MSKEAEKLAGEALQAQERLHLQLRRTVETSSDVFQKSIQTLDNLREIKASLDGSGRGFQTPYMKEHSFLLLKQLVLMHVPDSVNDEVQEKFRKLVFEAFEDTVDRILCVVLLTCPWYQATQSERGEQARRNILCVVYVSHIQQFMAPVNQHTLDEAFVTDKGWLYAVELFPFVHFLTKGKVRCAEILYCHQRALLYSDELWDKLKTSLPHSKVTGLRGFVEACKGQSVLGIGKKEKNGKFRVKQSTNFQQLCDSFRLQHHVYNVGLGQPPCVTVAELEHLPEPATEGFNLLQKLYKNHDVPRSNFLDVLLRWRDINAEKMQNFQFANQREIEDIVGSWQLDVRMQKHQLTEVTRALPDEYSKFSTLLAELGGPVAKLQPEQILVLARAGSYLYGLSTPTSDEDYLIIYREPTKNVVSRCKPIKDNFESRGPTKVKEYGAYEARLFCEMLLKGSIVILELVFADNLEYMSPFWKELISKRQQFVTEKAIQQYLGILRNNYSVILNGKHKGSPMERKLFYQIFHKEDCIRSLMKGEVPNVRCSGKLQEFIMDVRTKPLEGELDRQHLVDLVKEKIDCLLQDLADRTYRLKENMDYDLVTQWLLDIRGITTKPQNVPSR